MPRATPPAPTVFVWKVRQYQLGRLILYLGLISVVVYLAGFEIADLADRLNFLIALTALFISLSAALPNESIRTELLLVLEQSADFKLKRLLLINPDNNAKTITVSGASCPQNHRLAEVFDSLDGVIISPNNQKSINLQNWGQIQMSGFDLTLGYFLNNGKTKSITLHHSGE